MKKEKDVEIVAMEKISAILAPLTLPQRLRVMTWINGKTYELQSKIEDEPKPEGDK